MHRRSEQPSHRSKNPLCDIVNLPTPQNERKRGATQPTEPSAKRPITSLNLQRRPPSPSSILEALFASQSTQDAQAQSMDDSGTDADFFHQADLADSTTELLGSSPGTGASTSSSNSPHAAKHEGSSTSRPSIKPQSRKAPAWQLFREDSPEHIFLPLPSTTRSHSAEVKAVPQNNKAPVSLATMEGTANLDAQPPESRSGEAQGIFLAPFIAVKTHMRVKIMQAQSDGRAAVPWGVQYYLASLVSFDLVGMDELIVTTGINALRSHSNAQAICALFDPGLQHLLWESRIDTPVMTRRITDRERQVFAELDRETKIRADSPFNGVLGPPGEKMRTFGGRILFEGRFISTKVDEPQKLGKRRKHREFSVQLFPPKLGGSCRFSRRFGSESILRLKMDPAMAKDARRFALHPKTGEIQQEILQLLTRTVQIMGRRYRAFFCKDDTVFYLWVGSPKDCPEQPPFETIWDFIDHHAPFAENGRSQLGKYVQRLQLGLSTSVPASVIEEMFFEPDIFGDPIPETGDRVEMTDGAGSVSLAVARDIAHHLGDKPIPSAFQGRVGGSKGVWYVDPAAERSLSGEAPRRWIRIRDSQKKIHYPEGKPLDLSQLVVDLLEPSRTNAPSTLSRQIILVLESNGVPITTFVDMQRAELQAIVEEVSNWEGPNETVCMRLAAVVDRLCKVETSRGKRSIESAEHRAQGMQSPMSNKNGSLDPGLSDDDRELFFGQNGRHLWNGKPASKHECAYEMLTAGFHPRTCSYLADLLVDIADTAMKRLIKRFAIPVARSAEAMVIPDPTGTLEEGEIQFQFSGETILDPDTGHRLAHVPEGDVLVTRHPCLLPIDIRKVRAVVRPELTLYRDVVVFSTKGQRPLASLLSGGDYDGDLIRVFWEPKLVEPFQNADIAYVNCPFKIGNVFDRSEKTVGDFVAAHGGKGKDERDRVLIQELVAGAFQPALHGLYGIMHLYAAWQFGTRSAQAVELAHKFCQCMDSQKTGLVLKAEVRIRDSKLYLGELPEWAHGVTEEVDPRDWFGRENHNSSRTALKNKERPKSVLCALWSEGKNLVGQLKQQLHRQTEKLRNSKDPAISSLWEEAKARNRVSAEEEQAIRQHVKVMEESFVRTNAKTRQVIESRGRDVRAGRIPARKELRRMPLRRVQSEAKPVLPGLASADQANAGAVDDLNSSEMVTRLNDTIEVPTILGSASEVAARFCHWPERFVISHISKMDRAEVHRLALLRASYAYSITYSSRPRFAFEMAWRWILNMKAEASGDEPATSHGDAQLQTNVQGAGSSQKPNWALDLLGLRRKIIQRNYEISQGRSAEV